ncbi:LLM class F420-dependent oxidoreductase [Mycobacterium sp. SMC-4]|uniref:LLM class F420-dependent oxidoreductase n=1 Tax=Mycobacterium sp. SMC-4 TaxID=2857059 RepID=UPI0021B2E30E|nr:LLM class F420-dependent oxidoreductase [Mycobacterium sp. SMC-4]
MVLPHSGPASSPAFIKEFAQAAERQGFAALWAVDHLVLPRRVQSPYVLGRAPVQVADDWLAEHLSPNFEMVTTLAWVAAHTTSIGLGTSVSVLPIRHPIANARQLATLDALSEGRLTYGVGIGWMREEADAMGLPWERRAARSEEHVAVLRALWEGDQPFVEFHGKFVDFNEMDRRPQPTRRTIPILVGGHSPAALQRAVRIGDGWIAAPMPPERLAALVAELRRYAAEAGRTRDGFRIVAATAVESASAFKTVQASYRDIGVDHLQLLLPTSESRQTMKLIGDLGLNLP